MSVRMVRAWAWVGLGAQILLVTSWLAAGFWQGPGYSVVSDSISDLTAETAPAGLPLAFVISLCGLGTMLFAWLSVRPSLRAAGRLATIGAALLGLSIYGLGDLLEPIKRVACRIADAGCSPADQLATIGGVLDVIVSLVGIVVFIGAVFVLSRAMARTTEWRELAGPARRLGLVFIGLLVATVLIGVIGATGLGNRALAISGAIGIAWFAWRIARSSPTSPVTATG